MSVNATLREFKRINPHICYYCGKIITEEKDLTVDHVIPSSKGGKSIPKNAVVSCSTCNTKKGSMNFDKFVQVYCNNSKKMIELREKLKKQYRINNKSNYIMPITNKTTLMDIKERTSEIISLIGTSSFSEEEAYEYCLELATLYQTKKKIRKELKVSI